VIARLKAQGLSGDLKSDSTKVFNVIREIIKETKAVRFEGNGYSAEWVTEAQKRGLLNLRKSPEAIQQMMTPSTIKMFTEHNVLTEPEVQSRFNVKLERYIKSLQIEVDCLRSMVSTQILPACFLYHGALAAAVANAKAAGVEAPQTAMLKELSVLLTKAQSKFADLTKAAKTAEDTHDEFKKADLYATVVASAMGELRSVVDDMESVVADEVWPLPKYREMLFIS